MLSDTDAVGKLQLPVALVQIYHPVLPSLSGSVCNAMYKVVFDVIANPDIVTVNINPELVTSVA